jgi:hypothetical protein
MSAGRLIHDQNLEEHEIGYINTLGPMPPLSPGRLLHSSVTRSVIRSDLW